MPELYSGLACNLDSNILATALPLFEAEKVQAIEWSFDSLFGFKEIPGWFTELVSAFGNEGRLVGHGVFFSIFSGKWQMEQSQWLDNLRQLSKKFRFDHITEHFGFLTGQDFHSGAPLSIPYTKSTLSIGIDRLKRIYDACQCPVGLENLAFSYSVEEVKQHGLFLQELVEPVNGFIILDLHNLFCQLHNFKIDFETLIALYPLHLVREIHISGGSWEPADTGAQNLIRRDTHDNAVPEEVFELLKHCITRCPNLKFVFLEQLGTALNTEKEQARFRTDFDKMQEIVQSNCPALQTPPFAFLPSTNLTTDTFPVEDTVLFDQQTYLSGVLETARSLNEAKEALAHSPLARSDWKIEHWDEAMLKTAMSIAQKWKDGFRDVNHS